VRRRSIPLLLAALLLAGCGTTGSEDEPKQAATPAVGTDEQSVDALEEQLQGLAREQDAAKKAGDTKKVAELETQIQAIERAQDEAIEEEIAADEPYDRAIDTLPLHEPPLHVAQFVVDETHELVVRVRPKRFFCGRSEAQRLDAVRAYYEDAREAMAANGIEDFVMVVDELRETGEVTPLARAEGDDVSLTARGRGAGPC
jgi:hypothetical protein